MSRWWAAKRDSRLYIVDEGVVWYVMQCREIQVKAASVGSFLPRTVVLPMYEIVIVLVEDDVTVGALADVIG